MSINKRIGKILTHLRGNDNFIFLNEPLIGGMAEWLKAAVLKTVERKFRGFESYSLRQIF